MSELVGLWRLVSYADLDESGAAHEGPLGPAPRGLLHYGTEGCMSVCMMRTGPVPSGGAAYMGYAGGWRLSGTQVVHEIEVCSNPAWADTEQIRDLTLEGDLLVLLGTAMVNGKPQRRQLTWRRCAAR
ncbi:MAG: lipocalin-like domain-containing protein [Pseudonocardiaceae bacterium]